MKLKTSLQLNTLDLKTLKLPVVEMHIEEETLSQNEKIKVLTKAKKPSVSFDTEELF